MVGINENEYKPVLSSYGIYDRRNSEFYEKMSRIGIVDPYTSLTGAKEYLFFTKPDLNIFSTRVAKKYTLFRSKSKTQGVSDDMPNIEQSGTYYEYKASSEKLNPQLEQYPFFVEMRDRYRGVVKQLQSSAENNTGSPFMCLLSNSVRDTLDLPDISTREVDTPATVYGTTISYEADDFTTDENHSFSLEFEDTKYLEVYMLFKCWHEYMRKKTFGVVDPVNKEYITNKILHDQISIFKFIVGDDGETLIHYSKLYGCRPQGVPRQSFSDLNPSNGLRYSVSWKATFVEDMDPSILMDFNTLTQSYRKNKPTLNLYNAETDSINQWASSAYIVREDRSAPAGSPGSYVYKLKWVK